MHATVCSRRGARRRRVMQRRVLHGQSPTLSSPSPPYRATRCASGGCCTLGCRGHVGVPQPSRHAGHHSEASRAASSAVSPIFMAPSCKQARQNAAVVARVGAAGRPLQRARSFKRHDRASSAAHAVPPRSRCWLMGVASGSCVHRTFLGGRPVAVWPPRHLEATHQLCKGRQDLRRSQSDGASGEWRALLLSAAGAGAWHWRRFLACLV